MGKPKRFIRKRIKKLPYILFYTYLLFVLMSLFSVASYTWFVLSKTPQVSNMNVYITSATGLELAAAPDAEVWSNQLDIYSTAELKQYQGKNQKKPSLYQATWSERDQKFYGPLYGYDGRLMPLVGFDYSKMEIISWYPLEDQIHANSLEKSNYYIKATLYARSGQPTDVSLAGPIILEDGSTVLGNTYVLGDPHTGRGPETAVRIGFRMTYVDSEGKELSERSPMYIYEPNADRHVDGSTDYIPTYSIDEFRPPEPTEESTGVTTEETAGESQEEQLWFLVDEERLMKQTFSRRDEPGEFLTTPTLFSVKADEIVRIELYIWLEGQDVDCSNAMSDGVTTTKIEANIQFTGTSENQSGMVPIE